MLKRKFERASKRVWNLTEKPSNGTLLRLYALYKQATQGDVGGRKPYSKGQKAIAKWNAWFGVKGTASEDAMKSYIELVESLLA